MIELHVDDYCQYCPEFEVVVEKTILSEHNGKPKACDIDIRCCNRNLCERLYYHLSKRKDNK